MSVLVGIALAAGIVLAVVLVGVLPLLKLDAYLRRRRWRKRREQRPGYLRGAP